MKLYFDLATQERWHRLEWESRLAKAAAAQPQVGLAASRAEADFVITPFTPQLSSRWREIFEKLPADEFVWDGGDQPAGRHPGFYCSLKRGLFDPARHRSFCYPVTYNEQVREFDRADATELFSFVGGITSPVRSRLVDLLSRHSLRSRGIVEVQGGPWTAMFDRSGLAVKRAFADSLRRARFIFCPRGNGVGSIRLFEVMQAGRVPVIISDGYVLPEGVDWKSCAILVRERDLDKIPGLLAEKEDAWERMAQAARRSWEERFSDAGLFKEMARHLIAIRAGGRAEARSWTAPLVSAAAVYQAMALYRTLQSRRKKK